LAVTSRGFRTSSDSVGVLHEVRRDGDDDGSLLIETFNRWVVRAHGEDNEGLAKSAPPEFRNDHLPPVPEERHSWRRYRPAVERLSFLDEDPEWESVANAALPYRVDADRDLNGVWLFYFASYFDLFRLGAREAAMLAGVPEAVFRSGAAVEQEVVFLRNANAGDLLEIASHARRHRSTGAYVFDVVVRRLDGETLAISTETMEFGTSGRERAPAGPRVVSIDAAQRPPATTLRHLLERTIAETVGCESLPADRTFGEMGCDSCARLDVLARLESLFGPLAADLTFREATLDSLASHLLRHHAAAAQRLLSRAEPRSILPQLALEPDRRFEPFPLTEIQRAYLAGRSDAFPLGGKGCHLYWEFEAAAWDLERLQSSWRTLVERHDMLRATFSFDGTQRVAREVPAYPFQTHDLRASGSIEEIRERIAHTDFAPGQWPLFRIEVSVLPDAMRLHFAIDMLLVDGPSLFLLMQQWADLYAGVEVNAPAIAFRDYVQRRAKAPESAHEYWASRSLPPAPLPPGAADLQAIREPRFQRLAARLAPEVWAAFRRHASVAGVTPVTGLLTAFAETLRLWTREPEFTLNVTVANRLPVHPEIGAVVGDFTSNVLLAIDAAAAENFSARASRVQDRLNADLAHSAVSGVEAIARRARETGESIMMPVVFTSFLGYTGILEREARCNALGSLVAGLTETPQVWLDCQALELDGALQLSWDLADGVLPAELGERMFDAFRWLVERLGREENLWRAPRRQTLPDAHLEARRRANATAKAFEPAMIHSAFLEQARRNPDWTAVVDARRSLTYGELAGIAGCLAEELRAAGAKRNELVAIVMEKGWEEVAAALAVTMSGAAYLPIDAHLPERRIRQLLELGGARIALTQPGVSVGIASIPVTAETGNAPPPEVEADPSDLAYVIFTSGSTGVPKGVMIDHRGAVNTIRDINERFRVGARDRGLALSALNFDLSVWDIFGVLGAGGTVVIPDPASLRDPLYLAELARRERVTIWNSVPSFLQMMVEAVGAEAPLPNLRLAMMSGDWIPVRLPERLRALCPKAKTVSLGGATEASIWSICYPIEDVDPAWKSIPYGKPMANQTFHVLNRHLEDCPDGVPGELYIGGAGVALGYWRDEERTRASFVQHPDTGERLYRTGDWGCYLANGAIEFLGRADLQVKVGGHRIELGEIEAALARCEGVGAAMAVTFADEHRQKRLAAFVTAKNGRVDVQRVRASLAEQLPSYMVPAHVFAVPTLPVTANGKVDRKALEAQAAAKATAGHQEEDPLVRALASASLGMDPEARQRFVESRVAIRSDLHGGAIPLGGVVTPEKVAAYRRRKSSRAFAPGPVDLRAVAELLGLLRSIEIDGQTRRRFPSAGGSYAVQTYLHARAGGVLGLDAGVYYYQPDRDELQMVTGCRELPAEIHAPANRTVFAHAAFSIFLIADMRAIQPLYGDLSADLVKLEAGYMGQVLADGALANGLGLCPIGFVAFEEIRTHFRVSGEHLLLHSFLGGVYAAEEQRVAPAVVRDGSLVEQIAGIWAEVLRRPQLNPDENFFEAGGTSFAAIEAHRRIVHGLGIPCTITDLFRYPTVRSLAERLGGHAPAEPPSRRDRRRAARATGGPQ
jgi:epothilone synthetase B